MLARPRSDVTLWIGSRRGPVLAAVLLMAAVGLLAAAPIPGSSAQRSLDGSLLRIEQAGASFAGWPELLEVSRQAVALSYGERTAEPADLLRAAAAAAFDADAAAGRMRESLSGVALPADLDAEAFAAAARRLAEAQDALATGAKGEAAGPSTETEEAFARRRDRARIETLTGLMAAPEIAAETALTAQHFAFALKAFFTVEPDKLDKAPREDLDAMIAEKMARARSGGDIGEAPYPRAFARDYGRARLVAALSTLPPADVSTLLAFYDSKTGRAKRQALIETYARLSDEANEKTLTAYFLKLPEYLRTNPQTDRK